MRYVREGRYRLDMFASEGRYRLAIFARGVTDSLYSRGALPPRYYMTPLQGYDDAKYLQGAFPPRHIREGRYRLAII